MKPSYGCVSRYGLIDLSMSLDQIGPIAKNIEDAALLLGVIAGKDDKDTKTFDSKPVKLEKISKITLGLVNVKGVHRKIQELMNKAVGGAIKEHGWKKKDVEIKHIDLAVQTYYPLVYTEFFSATRRFDGRKYGKKIEDVAGKEVLRRILGGAEIARAEFAGRYYHKALAVKEMIKVEFEKALSSVDCLIMPTCSILPWKLGAFTSAEEMYAADALAIPANLAEVCAVSVPVGKVEGKPVGLQVMCGKGEEGKMLSIAKEVEKLSN